MLFRSALIVASKTDQASLNIAQNIIREAGLVRQPVSGQWEIYQNIDGQPELVLINKELIYTEPADLPQEARPLVFVSKHRSNIDTPALTVHANGNLTSEALYGGQPEQVAIVEPFRIQAAISTISSEVNRLGLGIEVTMEATHHGPTTFPVPTCFVEVGSGPAEWGDHVLGNIVAKAAIRAAHSTQHGSPTAVGFGGTHYPAHYTKLNIEGRYHIGHVVSRYSFDRQVSDRVLQDTFKKTVGGCQTGLVDWKGLKGEQRRSLLDKLAAWDVEAVRV